jgi:hypothetical protein
MIAAIRSWSGEMNSVQLLVSLNKVRMLEAARTGAQYDIGAMIVSVPSATIISGDPTVAVQVEVDPRHADALRRSVQEFCLVSPYQEFSLLAARSGFGRRRYSHA